MTMKTDKSHNVAPLVEIEIGIDDIRAFSLARGFNPDTWRYQKQPNGYYGIYRGVLSVGELIFEDHAQILVNELNAKVGT